MSLSNTRRLVEYYFHNGYESAQIFDILRDKGVEVDEAWVNEVFDELVKEHG